MQRLLALVMALALLMVLPAAASAGKATRFTDHVVSISCDGAAGSGGGFAFFAANLSDQFGADGFVDYWTTSTPEGEPALVRDGDGQVTITWNGSVLAGSIPLIDTSTGDAAAPATFSATLTPSGDPFPFVDEFRDGNHQHKFSGIAQPMDPAGTLVVGTSTFSLDGCYAEEATVSVFETNPRSFVTHFSDRSVGCDLVNADGDTAFLFTSLEEGEVFIDVGASPADGSPGINAVGSGILTNGVLDTTLQPYDPETGEPIDVDAMLHLVIAGSGEPFDYLLKNATFREVGRGVILDIEGTLTIDSMVFDLGPCVGFDSTTKIFDLFPNGPKPGGKVPANDLPSGAKVLTVGSRTSVATKGATPLREAPFECLTFEEGGQPFEVPVAHTVWYRIVGTGGMVTVDTAGSDYDTVVAVYTAAGGGFTPVADACVDDVALQPVGRTLQAAVTWQTVAGATYYVQIGGYPQSFPYGNLRVAVR